MRNFRRLAIALFLVSYFSSSFVATQFRSVRTAQHVLGAEMSSHAFISEAGRQLEDTYPRYREAKKAGFFFDFGPVASIDLPSFTKQYGFPLFQLYWETHHSMEVPAGRAPPFQTV